MSHIEWAHDGRQLLIPVWILPPTPVTSFDGIDAVALIDTGSTTSGVSGSIATALALVGRGKRPLGSVGGEVQAERYLFRLAVEPAAEPSAAPSFPFVFDDVIGFELRQSGRFNALIGMDVLRHCDLLVRRNGTARLTF